MATIDIDDTTIYYQSSGTGPPVLFIHGLAGDASTFADAAERIADRYRCVTYDRRGHTRSSWGTSAICDSLHADDAAALIESLDLAPCLVVGSSGGANIATDLMLRHGHLLRGVALSEPPLFSIDPTSATEAMSVVGPIVARAAETGDRRRFVDEMLHVVAERVWLHAEADFREAKLANADIAFADVTAPSLEITADDLATVHVPVLLLTGDASPPFHRSIVRAMAATLPDARVVELEDCGHVTHLERPNAFERAMRAFAVELDRRADEPTEDGRYSTL